MAKQQRKSETETPETMGLDASPAEAPADPVLHRYEVKLKHHPSDVIEAGTPEEAWELFKAKWGVIASDWQPEIAPLPLSGLPQ